MSKGVYAHGRKGMEWHNPLRRTFERFAAKGPVNVPGAQKSAHQAYEDIKHLLTQEERNHLVTARSHALGVSGTEGRAEFDSVCAQIRKRLFG